jgi:hypothetical protein
LATKESQIRDLLSLNCNLFTSHQATSDSYAINKILLLVSLLKNLDRILARILKKLAKPFKILTKILATT